MTTYDTAAPAADETASTASPVGRKGKKTEGTALGWVLALFGTAMGAGILFLPLQAGTFGFWPLAFATAIIFPVVYFSHRTYARIVSGAPVKDHGLDVLELVRKYLGRHTGLFVALMYSLANIPTVFIYAISLTNAIDSFIVNQLHGPSINRWVLSVLCVGILTGIFAIGRKPMLWLAQVLVYPLIVSLAATSIYLIPQWDLRSFMEVQYQDGSWQYILLGSVLILPVLAFSFSHMAGLSQFSVDMQPTYGEKTEKHVTRIEFYTAALLVVFTMFFVWSCVLALGADGMKEATEQNLPVLSYFANVTGVPLLAWLAPMVVIFAIITSYFGTMLGAEEGTSYMVRLIAPRTANRLNRRGLLTIVYTFIFVTGTLVSVFNPPILSLIYLVGGVFDAVLIFLLPVYMFHRVKEYKTYRHDPWNYFVFFFGSVILAVTIWDLF